MSYRRLIASLAGILTATMAYANDVPEQSFKIIGTWSNASTYKGYEAPLWNEAIPEASSGKIKADMQAIDELGLSGSEAIKLLSTGAYDVGFALYSYIVSGDPIFEGFDLALVARSAEEQRKVVGAFSPVIEKAMSDVHRIKLVTNYPFPLPVIACRDEFKSLEDLKGRKVRVFATTQSDLMDGLGAISVSIPLAEVPTALQRGVVDCAMASAIAMYKSKWFDVVNYLYEMPIGGAMGFMGVTESRWAALDDNTRALIEQEAGKFADRTWSLTHSDEQQGIACLTGELLDGDACKYGEPAKMKLVRTSPADAGVRERILSEFVLKRYAERCGPECAKAWSDSAGAAVNISIAQ
ncbi:TRAP transporter substrate-binding protein [Mesorhizobium sp. 1B3]|uniref:TRAP transporter substrate-binding protein n=1 Tax=Mesorhizobium sp. 1B3 TaxID=3243599 RepID=UPI003D97A472